MKTAKENKRNEIKGTQVQQQHIMVRLAVTLQRCLTSAVALGDASGKSGVRARERQVRGGAFRWERQVSDEGRCARRVGGRCGDRAHPRYGAGGGFARLRRAVPGGVPRPPFDLGAGRGRVSENATAGVCPPRGGRTPRGRCNDGSA